MKRQKEKPTLCEKSMFLVANIIKLSSAHLASISTFGASSVNRFPAAEKTSVPAGAKVPTTDALLVPQRQQKAPSKPEEISGSRQPHKDGPSDKDINERASVFIKRVHENNLNACTQLLQKSNPAP